MTRERTAPKNAPRLRVTDLTLTFGGIKALDKVSFTVEPKSVHALIGPNGAGKSSCFNVLTGVYRATSGSVRFGDDELTRLAPHRITRLGLSRTFQNIALSGEQSVLDNLMVGRHHLTRSGFIGAGLQLPWSRREERTHHRRVTEIAAELDLADRLHVPAASLSYGEQKRVEVARALATEPRLLMLDEPVAGMNAAESEAMARTVVTVRDRLGIAVLLVEHDMSVVMRIADRVSVLDFGRLIADGPAAEVRADPEVVRAYLGTPQPERREPA
ncbi:ABC transporter ATP-binding protein [Actinomadura sp. 3N407]|uniref:ABC transporter ATP-binding protein n=1 Tax=Actinomadura sp. 3N407 TaxID=3457423 RepID=UPI003FCDBF9E